MLAYTDAVDALGRQLLPLCAMALDLPPDTFDAAFAESQFSFRLTHYPPVAAEPNQFGIAPHTDANFLTFLAQSEVPGLQVRMPDGTWVDVPYVPGSFAVNSGDMMHAVDQRPVQVHAPPRPAAGGPSAVRDPLSSWARTWTP